MEEIILRERETKEKIMNAINESQLPAVLLKSILKEFLEQIVVLEQKQYEKAVEIKINKEKAKKEKENKNG